MESAPSSSTSRTKAKAKDSLMCFSGFDGMNEDLLFNVLSRLPAQSFASAACASKSWNRTCNRVLCRPKLASALSLKPSLHEALREVFDKILSEPIRPHFAIANVGNGFEPLMTLRLIRKKLGCSVPIIVSVANGIFGRDALTNELKEVNWNDLLSELNDEADVVPINEGIIMTIGFLPGLKVDAIPLFRQSTLSMKSAIDKFVMDVKEYSASVSRCSFPLGILLFGEGSTDMKPVMEKLDYVMPKDTFIVGDERGRVAYRSGNDSRNAYARTGYLAEAVALVFAQDGNRSPATGEIKFHVALSNGVLPMGDKYKTASVRTSTEGTTWLTARREGQQEILDGQRILDDITNELANLIHFPDLYIGVFKRRKLSVGSEKPRQRISISFHGVESGDEQYLYVDGVGLKTGDVFQLYHSDRNAALASCSRVSDELKKIEPSHMDKDIALGLKLPIMKPSLIALFILCAFIASSAKAFVLDINGEPVTNGGSYYILPLINILGGGLTLAKTGNETCPLSVKPYPTLPIETNYGLPWIIASPLRIRFIPTNSRLDFLSVEDKVPSCAPYPSSWTIVEEEDGTKSVKISKYGNTIEGVFQIQKYTKIAYKIVFCPTDGDSCRDIGLSSSRALVITDDIPLGLIFVKVESSEASKEVVKNVLEA